ncbi:MAG: hypothetical protein QOE06_1846 [Thermoleophilaceae bacterium]|nr:hypothetical protein [Thermoleophilaceae bacterium]
MSTEGTPQGQPQGQPTEEELRAAFEDQMRRITVPDVLVQTAVTLVNLGGQKLAEDHDLEQTRSAIEGARALLPLLPEDIQTPLRDALSQLQMAFVRESQDPGGEPAGEPPPAAAEPAPQQAPQQAGDEAERANARSKIWTPRGS